MARMISILVLLFSIYVYCASKPIIFKGAKVIVKQAPTSQSFSKFFSQPSLPKIILSLNPGINTIEEISGTSTYKCQVAGIKFPGITVASEAVFDVEFDGSSNFTAILNKGGTSLKTEGGPKFIASIIQKLLPSVESRTSITYDPTTNSITNSASLITEFNLPAWFPLPRDSLSSEGSAAIQKSMETDLDELLENIIKEYYKWESNESNKPLKELIEE
mmetsp:Transcript_8958/g.9010  ORF Transcript_8958/g.9010 Transcript_8958/m.9010 type:complete len:218 (-) Transcript_8958:198-851(-)